MSDIRKDQRRFIGPKADAVKHKAAVREPREFDGNFYHPPCPKCGERMQGIVGVAGAFACPECDK